MTLRAAGRRRGITSLLALQRSRAMNLLEPILADAATIAAIRRDLHAHPELCFEEVRTADVVANALTD